MLPSELDCPPITKQGSRIRGFCDLANLRHRAKHSSHYIKDKQRFVVVSVVAYDSLLDAYAGSHQPVGPVARPRSGYKSQDRQSKGAFVAGPRNQTTNPWKRIVFEGFLPAEDWREILLVEPASRQPFRALDFIVNSSVLEPVCHS
jgi:hypothetical protein